MARSPFQGTFRPNLRPTVVTAPDGMVFINGETDVIGCPSCKRRFPFNKFITTIQVDLSVDSVPGSANLNMSIPRHSIDDFYYEGNPVITPMMEVEIYLKGNYLLEGLPQYYPVFWGLITEVGDSYSGGEHTVSINCADILKWWELCRMNINPAYTGPKGQMGWSVFGNVTFGKNPYDMIWTLAQHSMGDVIVGTGSLVSMYKEQGSGRAVFDAALSDMMVYWQERFSRIRSGLLLYGVNGVAVRGDTIAEMARNKTGEYQGLVSSAVMAANGGADNEQMVFDPASKDVVAFRTQGTQAGEINLWQAEYQTKLELANACKEVAGFELFMDMDGTIVFKPPFYNLDIMANKPVSWIQDIDIIDWNFSESEAEVITQIQMQGNYTGSTDWGLPEECTPFTSVTDYHLLRKYGWRVQNYNSEFMSSPQSMFYHGMDILDRINSKRHRGSVTIPIRPELRLGFPVYIAPKDQIWYITGISHNLSFGGRAQTQLTLTAKRNKFIAPKGIGTLNCTSLSGARPLKGVAPDAAFKYSSNQLAKGASYELKVSTTGAAELPPTVADIKKVDNAGTNAYDPLILRHPKTGRLLGCPNAVMVYRRPFQPAEKAQKENQGEKTEPNKEVKKEYRDAIKGTYNDTVGKISQNIIANQQDSIKEQHHLNRYSFGLNSAGVYVYAYDQSKQTKIGELLLLPASRLKATTNDENLKAAFKTQTVMIRPVSDERGFEVVGHFRYGRGVALRDGSLVLETDKSKPNVNSGVQIGTQLALSGDLFSTLEAQSMGLTSITLPYANPADAVASLVPEDLETAGIKTPDMKKPEYVPAAKNFVDSAPLGSAAQTGLPSSVEASQLSKALTLAEMTVLEDFLERDDKCQCVVGRSDLAFLAAGRTIQVIGTADSATGTLPAPNVLKPEVDQGGPVEGTLTALAPSQAAQKVNTYLFSLYQALDEPHVSWEKAIRGEYVFGNPEGGTGSGAGGIPKPPSQLAPPWSAPSRYAAGDPAAAGQQGSSAVAGLSESWNSFSEGLQNNVERTYWTQKLAKDQADLASLQAQLAKAQSSNTTSSDVVDYLNGEIAKKQQAIAEDQQKLADLAQ